MRLTDGAFPDDVKVCFPQRYPKSTMSNETVFQDMYHLFGPVLRQWRALQLLKRAGVWSITQLGDGELAVQCVACPRPGFNLPEDWKERPDR